MLKLFKEAFSKSRDAFIKSRMEKTWKENLFFVPLLIIVLIALYYAWNFLYHWGS